MAKDQYRLHPAADIFRDHLLSKVEDENQKLGGSNQRLTSAREIFSNVELHLRDGYVMSMALIRLFVLDCRINCGYSVCISVDEDESSPRPLLDFSESNIRLMGQTVGNFPGDHLGFVTLLGMHTIGTIFLRFSLSRQRTVEGALRNLNVSWISRIQIIMYGCF